MLLLYNKKKSLISDLIQWRKIDLKFSSSSKMMMMNSGKWIKFKNFSFIFRHNNNSKKQSYRCWIVIENCSSFIHSFSLSWNEQKSENTGPWKYCPIWNERKKHGSVMIINVSFIEHEWKKWVPRFSVFHIIISIIIIIMRFIFVMFHFIPFIHTACSHVMLNDNDDFSIIIFSTLDII